MCQQFWKKILRFKTIKLKIQQEMYILPMAAREACIIVIFWCSEDSLSKNVVNVVVLGVCFILFPGRKTLRLYLS